MHLGKISVYLLTILMVSSVAAAQSDNIHSMKLLTSQVGWAASQSRLFWTTSTGDSWSEITPKASTPMTIASVFFLDASTGWALLSDENEDKPRFTLASTTSAGSTWTLTAITIPEAQTIQLSGGGCIDFSDSLHGWIVLTQVSSSAFSLGILLKTEDGGSTWQATSGNLPIADPLRFFTSKDGWMARLGGDELYVTHDGANSWQEVSLKAPPQVYPAVHATYDLPMFEDSKHGFLPVTYAQTACKGSALVLFATDNGGKTWVPYRILPNLTGSSIGQTIPSTVVQSNLMSAQVSGATVLTFTTVAADGKVLSSTSADAAPAGSAVFDLSFASDTLGWVLTSGGLLSTTDGGITWVDITPLAMQRPADPQSGLNWNGFTLNDAGSLSSLISDHESFEAPESLQNSAGLGFDQQFVACAKPQMKTWWEYSPYFDVGFYLNAKQGNPTFQYQKKMNHKYDENLGGNPPWTSNVENQGWGLIPLWVGLQAPSP